jgi:endonuclease/exonuclease/phosphatase family metal-dependent hydrolase
MRQIAVHSPQHFMHLKRFFTVFVALFALVWSVFAQSLRVEPPLTWSQSNPPTHRGPVSVAFWNIEWFPGGMSADASQEQVKNQVEAVAKILDEENPTIFVACEVRSLQAAIMLNNRLKQPYAFIAATDYRAVNRRGRESMANRQEHVIFSRIPWKEVWEVDFDALPSGPNKPARGFIGGLFIVNGRPLTVYGVHPKANYIRPGDKNPELTALQNVRKRERASELLLADIKRRGLHPLKDRILLVGDFNTDVYAERFQGEKSMTMLFQAGFFNAFEGLPPEARVTIRAKPGEPWPDTTFDYILSSVALGQLQARVIQKGGPVDTGAQLGQPGYASDHYMVKVSLPPL